MVRGLRRTPALAGVLAATWTVLCQGAAVATGAVPAGFAASDAVVQLAFAGIGVLAWTRRPESRTGALLVLTGAGLAPVNLAFSDEILLRTLGLASVAVFAAPLAHLLLAWPAGRLPPGRDRWVSRAIVFHLTVQWWALLLLYPEDNLIGVTDGRELFDVLVVGHVALNVVFALYVEWVLLRRWRRLTPAGRWAVTPVLAAGAWIAFVTVATAPSAYAMLDSGPPDAVLQSLWAASFVAVPAGILVGLLRTRASRAHLGLLTERLRTCPPPGELRDTLASALGDPSLELGFWVREVRGYRDVDGRPLELPEATAARAVTPVGDPALPPAILVHDPQLAEDEGLLEAVGAAAGLALENARLQAEANAQLAEADAARARLVDAADAARRRIERELREGAQQRLADLSAALRDLDTALDEDRRAAVLPMLEMASGLVEHARGELTDLARGVYPAELVEGGLRAALVGLAAATPLSVEVDVDPSVDGPNRPPANVEAAAYFLCCEAVTNAVKHSGASHAQVHVARRDSSLVVTVRDDGAGGARIGEGSGLAGLADRVAAHGGRLRVLSPEGEGTVVTAALVT